MKHMILLLWTIHRLPDMQWYANELSNTIATPHEMSKMPKSEKKKMCVLTWYGGLPQILTASATLIDLIVQFSRQFVPFPLNHDFFGPNNYSTRLVRRSLLQSDRFSQLSCIQFLDLRLTIDWLCRTAYFLFRGSYLIYDDIYRIPRKKQRWDKSYPLSSYALEHTDSIQPFGGSFAQGLRWTSGDLEILSTFVFHFLNKLSLPKRGAESDGFFNLSLRLTFIARFVGWDNPLTFNLFLRWKSLWQLLQKVPS